MTTGQGTAVQASRRAPERQRARQQRIVTVAMEHFATRGYEAARIEEIASEAGVDRTATENTSSIVSEFPSSTTGAVMGRNVSGP